MKLAIDIAPDGSASAEFEHELNGYAFVDRIVLTPEEFTALGEQGVAAMAQQRFDDWYAAVTAVEG